MSFRIDPAQGLSPVAIAKSKQAVESWKKLEALTGRVREIQFDLQQTIVVNHQLKYGESLYLRGDGFCAIEGDNARQVTWDKGIKMENIGPDCWKATVNVTTTKIAFKLLINDTRWEQGDNHNFVDMKLLMTRAIEKAVSR